MSIYWCKVTVVTIYEFEVEAEDEQQASFQAGRMYQDWMKGQTKVAVEVKEVTYNSD